MNLKSPLIQSLAGFFAALIVGALLPRTLGMLLKRVVLSSLRDVVAVLAAGLIAERLFHWISRYPYPKRTD
ncbi:MAG: hypothetical protein RIE53_06305 [Rhodothermales bacterium]